MLRRAAVVVLCAAALTAGCASKGGSKASPTSTTKASGGPATTTPATCSTSLTATSVAAGGKEVNPPGDIPDHQRFVLYNPPEGRYTVRVPEGWSRTEGPRTAHFTDKFNAINVELLDAPAAPTVASASDTEFAALRAHDPCAHLVGVTSVTRTAGAAVLVRYQTDSPADAVTGKVLRQDVERYEFWRNGTEVVFTLSGAVGADNVDPWKTVTGSFAWL